MALITLILGVLLLFGPPLFIIIYSWHRYLTGYPRPVVRTLIMGGIVSAVGSLLLLLLSNPFGGYRGHMDFSYAIWILFNFVCVGVTLLSAIIISLRIWFKKNKKISN